MLQWGHGGEAEARPHRRLGSADRFNGATAVRPWKTLFAWSSIDLSLGTRLQWGHGGEAVEHCRRRALKWQQRHRSFNSATAVRPWKTTGAS